MRRTFSANGTGRENPFLDRQRQAIAAVSPVLDQINAKFIEAERKLRDSQPVGDVAIMFRQDMLGRHWLALVKNHLGQWRLSYGVCHAEDEEPTWRPIVEASRQIRVEVASEFDWHYAALQRAIAEADEEFDAKARKALETMTKTLE